MILVDTSVWIDYLRGNATPATRLLDRIGANSERIARALAALPENFSADALLYGDGQAGQSIVAAFGS